MKILSTLPDQEFLQTALNEMMEHIRDIKNHTHAPPDPIIRSLCDILVNHFSNISDLLYYQNLKNFQNNAEETLSDSFIDLNRITNIPYVPDADRLFYSYPDLYLDLSLSSSNCPHCMQILPYLLASYYINYSNNRIVNNDKSKTYADDPFVNLLFETEPAYNNYEAALVSFCNKFSLLHVLPRFMKGKRSAYPRQVRELLSIPELIQYLNKGAKSKNISNSYEMSCLHYQKVLFAYIYSICSICCSQMSELSPKIDYILSTNLFNAHTLAFETIVHEHHPIFLKDYYELDMYEAMLSALDNKQFTMPEFFPFERSFLDLFNPSLQAELAEKAPILIYIFLYRKNYPPFLNHNTLGSNLKKHTSLKRKVNRTFDFD